MRDFLFKSFEHLYFFLPATPPEKHYALEGPLQKCRYKGHLFFLSFLDANR
jgi:hypothetical protein